MNQVDKNGIPLKIGDFVITPNGVVGKITGCFEDCTNFFIIQFSYDHSGQKWSGKNLELVTDEQALLKILEQFSNDQGYLSFKLPKNTRRSSARVRMGRFFNGWRRWISM